jgi:predicted DNA-binding transcriptional regulator YafY
LGWDLAPGEEAIPRERAAMKRKTTARRRPGGHITLGRASRLHRLVMTLAQSPRDRESLLATLAIGLRTFYRELELLKKCGIRIRFADRLYTLKTTPQDAEGRLPFPDPQLSFAEMNELASYGGEASKRLAVLLAGVVKAEPAKPKRRKAK